MADITKKGPDCNDGRRGKRGKRGHRGHTGHTGPPGPSGLLGASGGLLKFSGVADIEETGLLTETFLADFATGLGTFLGDAPDYPIAVARSFRNLSVNLINFVVPIPAEPPPTPSVVVELLQNGVLVPGFSITYGPTEGGIKSVLAGPAAFAIGDTFDLRVSTVGFVGSEPGLVDVSATVGVE